MNTTITLARQHGAGAVLRATDGTRYTVRDFSPGTGDVYGYGYPEPGEYRQLPRDLVAVENVRRYAGLWLSSLNEEQHSRTCGYWFTVSIGAGGAHTAFRTREALMGWLELTGLSLSAELPADGVASSQRLDGEYLACLTMGPLPDGRRFRTLDNGRYSVGVRAAGCLWTRNVNMVRTELDWAESEAAIDAGRFYLDGEELRREAFRASPLLMGFMGTLLEDLQHDENDDACTDERDPRDVGTVWNCPDATFNAARAICDAFTAAAPTLDSSCSDDQLGSDLYMEMAGHGVGFGDREHDSDPDTSWLIGQQLSDAVDGRIETYVGDDGAAWIVGRES